MFLHPSKQQQRNYEILPCSAEPKSSEQLPSEEEQHQAVECQGRSNASMPQLDWTRPGPDPKWLGKAPAGSMECFFIGGTYSFHQKKLKSWWFSIAISSYVKLPGGKLVCMIKPWTQSYTIYFYYQLQLLGWLTILSIKKSTLPWVEPWETTFL